MDKLDNVVDFPAGDIDLHKTVMNLANEGIRNAIIIAHYDDDSIKVFTTAGPDLTAELIEDALVIMYPARPEFILDADLTSTCRSCGRPHIPEAEE